MSVYLCIIFLHIQYIIYSMYLCTFGLSRRRVASSMSVAASAGNYSYEEFTRHRLAYCVFPASETALVSHEPGPSVPGPREV